MKLNVPYFSEKTIVAVRDEIVEIKAYQIIVWVSISNRGLSSWNAKLLKFPAILDAGTTHNFALTKGHLLDWAGFHGDDLPQIGKIRKERENAHLHKASVWLHADDEPFASDVHEGIAIFEADWPRLPVLGLRALTNSKLQTFIYGDAKRVVIRTPPKWYWPF